MSFTEEKIILMNSTEHYNQHFMPSLLRSKTSPEKAALLCYYIQQQAKKYHASLILRSDHVSDIMVKFYNFEKIGFIKPKEVEKKAQIIYEPSIGIIKLPEYTVLDIYHTWLKYDRQGNIQELFKDFHKRDFEVYLKNVCKGGIGH